MTSIEEDIVPIMRGMIGDTEEPYTYTDNALSSYVTTGLNALPLRGWKHDYVIDEDEENIEPDVDKEHQVLIAMEAKMQLFDSIPSTSFKAGGLSVTRKDDNKKRLEERIKKAVRHIKMGQGVSFLRTEYDEFLN